MTRPSAWRWGRPSSRSWLRCLPPACCHSSAPGRSWGWRVPSEPILRARGFRYRYPEASAPALSGIDLDIEPGSFTVVAGESGSGKSTLLRAACGLVPHFHGGEVSGELAGGGPHIPEHGPRGASAVCGTGVPDP